VLVCIFDFFKISLGANKDSLTVLTSSAHNDQSAHLVCTQCTLRTHFMHTCMHTVYLLLIVSVETVCTITPCTLSLHFIGTKCTNPATVVQARGWQSSFLGRGWSEGKRVPGGGGAVSRAWRAPVGRGQDGATTRDYVLRVSPYTLLQLAARCGLRNPPPSIQTTRAVPGKRRDGTMIPLSRVPPAAV
jgi:hypothetical protein